MFCGDPDHVLLSLYRVILYRRFFGMTQENLLIFSFINFSYQLLFPKQNFIEPI